MFDYLGEGESPRKIRLFACACCRRVWYLLPEKESRGAVETAERFADGQATATELRVAQRSISQLLTSADWAAYYAAGALVWWHGATHAVAAMGTATAERAESAAQCTILRDLLGNPFRPVSFDPSWRTPDVRSLAEGIYEERAFDRLPYLADALEDAGCTDPAILGHCRDKGTEHYRGCWVVDLLTGRG
jgi:hypothetical protein